jgi:MFS family permease
MACNQRWENTMSVSSTTGGRSRNLVLTAMIFAVAMTFIDQTIVSIAAPTIQHALGLSSSSMQWAINSYLLALAAFFAFGGRLADTVGHRKMVVLGVIIFAAASALCGLTPSGGIAETWLVAAVGFALWAGKATDLHPGAQVIYIVIAGAGMGLMLGQANTDAVNRASRFSYGEATGITQTVRNYGASLGFAILGTILITEFRSRITSSLIAKGLPAPAASAEAAKIAQLQGGNGNVASIPQFIRADFAGATRDVLYVMALIMAIAGLVGLRGLKRGVQQETEAAGPADARFPGEDPDADLYSTRR